MTHQQKYNQRMTKYEEMGIASLLPGMIRMHEMMGEAIQEVQEQLARVQGRLAAGDEPDEEVPAVRMKRKKSAQALYWARMTVDERSAEMKRRGMVGRKKAAGKPTHPRDPRHPDHEAWTKKLSKRIRASWAKTTPEEHAARVAKMLASRAANRRAA